MQTKHTMIAVDLGASSGRVVLGHLSDKILKLEEIHRFDNTPITIDNHLHWDLFQLYKEIIYAIKKAYEKYSNISSISFDTWGVDYGLLDSKGELLNLPFHYRDKRTFGVIEEVNKLISKENMYSKTGLQFMELNTIFQLFSEKKLNKEKANQFLLMPDLFAYLLTGNKVSSYTIASTTQLVNSETKKWDLDLIETTGFNKSIFSDIVNVGHVIGELKDSLKEELKVDSLKVISGASHDTSAAVAAVPCDPNKSYAYLSSGTWSILGVESDKPYVSKLSLDSNFTNEGGVENNFRFSKNIMGLWIIQELRREWKKDNPNLSFQDMMDSSVDIPDFQCFIDVDDESFASPGNMTYKIKEYCKKTNQFEPGSQGEIIKCVNQSLAMKYKENFDLIEEITNTKIEDLYIVGGGVQNQMICQYTANVLNKQITTGPIEATSIGNILIQAITLGVVKDVSDSRQIIKSSFNTKKYDPINTENWDKAYKTYLKIITKKE